jgi:hypothetical protein
MSMFMNASSYNAAIDSHLMYAGLAFLRFRLPWLVCMCLLLLCKESSWSGFCEWNSLVRTVMNVVAAMLEAATLSLEECVAFGF